MAQPHGETPNFSVVPNQQPQHTVEEEPTVVRDFHIVRDVEPPFRLYTRDIAYRRPFETPEHAEADWGQYEEDRREKMKDVHPQPAAPSESPYTETGLPGNEADIEAAQKLGSTALTPMDRLLAMEPHVPRGVLRDPTPPNPTTYYY